MIVATGNDGHFILFGLSRKNVEMLMEGKPISMTADSHPGIPLGMRFCIMFGETERAIYDDLKDSGLLHGT